MPLDTHQLAPWQLLKQQLLQLATAATASAAALRATCCDLVLTKNRLKKKKPPSSCGQNRNTNGRRLAATATARSADHFHAGGKSNEIFN